MKYTIVGIIFVVIALYWFFQNRSARKQYINVFSGRKSLSNEAFYNKYFKDQNIPDFIVYGVKRVLEEQLDTDLSKLDAKDDFSTNLNFFFEIDSMADVEIVVSLEKEFDIKIEDKEAERAHTVRDIVNLVWGKVKTKS